MRIRSRILAVCAVVISLTHGTDAIAQIEFGNLYGRVVDNQGERLPGATVTLTGPAQTRIQVTNADGEFRFLELPPGNYKVEAALEGFSTVVHDNVNIRVGRNTTLDSQLTPAVEETIDIGSAQRGGIPR